MVTDESLQVPPHVLAYLDSHRTLTLATASPTGLPHAATMLYVLDGLALYLWSRPGTVTVRHVEQNPTVAFTVDDEGADWAGAKGVQATGQAKIMLNPAEIERAVALFTEKFAARPSAGPSNLVFVRINPTHVSFIDNETAGGREEQALGMEFHREVVFNVFRDLPRHHAASVAARLQTTKADEGAVIVRQGGPADKFFIIVDGRVEVVREDGGEERIVAELGPGQFFGEVAILRDTPRSATVRARQPTTLLTMEREDFRALVAQSLSTTQDLDQIIRQRLETLSPS